MALQGNLRDFSATEILQLLGTQKKTGCLLLEWNTEHALVYVHDGRIVATRRPGMVKDDPLLLFLLKIHRLSDEQYRGILTIQRESNRDLEDLLLNGRYLEAEELVGLRRAPDPRRPDARDALGERHLPLRSQHALARRAAGAPQHRRRADRGGAPRRRAEAIRHACSRIRTSCSASATCRTPTNRCPTRSASCSASSTATTPWPRWSRRRRSPSTRRTKRCTACSRPHWIEFVGRREPGLPHDRARRGADRARPGTALRGARGGGRRRRWWARCCWSRACRPRAPASNAPAPGRRSCSSPPQMRDLRFALELYQRERGVYPARASRTWWTTAGSTDEQIHARRVTRSITGASATASTITWNSSRPLSGCRFPPRSIGLDRFRPRQDPARRGRQVVQHHVRPARRRPASARRRSSSRP